MNRKILKKTLVFVLTVAITFTSVVMPVLAYYPEETVSQKDISLTVDGEEIGYQDSWDEMYPYGTFAFEDSEIETEEGKGEIVIPVYRLGGTQGRVTAVISFSPSVFAKEDGSYVFENAVSARDDIQIEYEAAQTIAQYQALGMPSLTAAPEGVNLTLTTDSENETAGIITLCDGEGNILEADVYRWQYRDEDGAFRNIDEAEQGTLRIALEDVLNDQGEFLFDYRCIYMQEDTYYCSPTLVTKNTYDPEEDGPKEIPEDCPYQEEPVYLPLETEDEYGGFEFKLTFAEGEWVKNIKVTTKDDEIPEQSELGIFAITECIGGENSSLCNSLTLTVNDDDFDKIEASQIGFKFTDYSVDQDAGKITIPVERTGDLSYITTVHYKTVEGTAKEGKQYAVTEGDLVLGGEEESAEITIPLVAETKRSQELTFTVELSDIKGGGPDNKCTLTEKRVCTVSLISTGEALIHEAGLNLASVLGKTTGEDISSKVSESEETMIPENAGLEIEEKEDDFESIEGVYVDTSRMNSFSYPDAIQLRRDSLYNSTAAYWKDKETPVGASNSAEDVVGYRNSFTTPEFETNSKSVENNNKYGFSLSSGTYGNAVQISHNDSTISPTTLQIENASLLFSKVESRVYLPTVGVARWDGDKRLSADSCRYVMPFTKMNINYRDDSSNFVQTNHDPQPFDSDKKITLTRSKSLNMDFAFQPGTFDISMSFVLNKSGAVSEVRNSSVSESQYANGSSVYRMEKLSFTRRVFAKTGTIGLNIYTANDEDTHGNYALLDADTEVYKHLRPEVSLVQGESGVTASGALYVGSKLRIELNNTATYSPYKGASDDCAIYISKTDGTKVPCKIEREGETNAYYVTWLWDGMTESDLKANYTINVIVERRQDIVINIKPSIKKDQYGNTSTNYQDVSAAYDKLKKNNDGSDAQITFNYSAHNDNAPYFTQNVKTMPFSRTLDSSGIKTITPDSTFGVTDLQSVNMGLDETDIVIFNGKMYKGNEEIFLEMKDLSSTKLTFTIYDEDSIEESSIMEATISHSQLFFDGNGNGRIDGYFDENIGYFVLDEESGDKDYGIVSGNINQKYLMPEVDPNGNIHQYFLKVFYNLTPRAIYGEDDGVTAQVLPAFITSLTDENSLAQLTSEQKSYRIIQAGASKANVKSDKSKTGWEIIDIPDTSEGHLIYGPAATKLSTVDIPLGGDLTSLTGATVNTDGASSQKMDIPEYCGNMRMDYDSPEEIIVKDYHGNSKSVADANDYLGAFINNTTYFLCVQETREITTHNDVNPESATLGDYVAIPDGDMTGQLQGVDSPELDYNSKNVASIGYGSDIDTNINLPTFSFDALGVDVSTFGGNQMLISYGIPVAQWAGGDKWSGTRHKDEDGNDVAEGIDTDGNKIKDVTTKRKSDDGKEYYTQTRTVEEPSEMVRIEGDPVTYAKKTVIHEVVYDSETNEKSYTNTTTYTDRYHLEESEGKTIVVADSDVTVTDHNQPNTMTSTPLSKLLAGTGKTLSFGDVWGPVSKALNGGSLFDDDSLKDAKNGLNRSKKISFTVIVKGAVLLEYDGIKGEWGIVKGTIGFIGVASFEIKSRFPACPIFYMFLRVSGTVGAEAEIKTASVKNEKGPMEIVSGSSYSTGTNKYTLNTGQEMIFRLDMSVANGFSMNLDGKVNMAVSDSPSKFDGDHKLTAGTLTSDGKKGTDVQLHDYGKTVYVCLVARQDGVQIENPFAMDFQKQKAYFNGVAVSAGLNLEFGFGVGVEVCKFEVFLKFNFKIVFRLGGYNPETDNWDMYGLTYYIVGGGLGIRLKFFLFEFTIDAIGGYFEGSRATPNDSWNHTKYWVAGGMPQSSLLQASNDNQISVQVKAPEIGAGDQKTYAAFPSAEGPLNAYIPTDENVKFELSGYGSSTDAFKLAEHLDIGSDYQALNVNGETYLLYTIKDPNCTDNAFNQQRIVLSKLVATGDEQGLANPLDATAATPYIFVDSGDPEGKPTGDLDFSYSVDGSNLIVSYVSYDKHFTADDPVTIEEEGKHTVVKQSVIDLSSNTGFGKAKVVSKDGESFRFTPKSSGNLTVYGETKSDVNAEKTKNMLRDYLKLAYGVTDEQLDSGKCGDADKVGYIFRYKSDVARIALYGDTSNLVVATEGGSQESYTLGKGETITNLQLGEADGKTLAIYTTEQTAYFDKDGKTIIENFDSDTEAAKITRMYSQVVTEAGFETPSLLRTIIDFDKCDKDNIESCSLQDGLYENGALKEMSADPYIANLDFLKADLDGSGAKQIFVFELSGDVYVMDSEALSAIAAGKKAEIQPIFSSEQGTKVTISSDVDGNLAMAYIASVNATTNNAIYSAWWDKTIGTWGQGNILAMNHMSVYENAAKYNLNADDMEKAFLGKDTSNEDYNDYVNSEAGANEKGAYDDFTFSDIQLIPSKVRVIDTDRDEENSNGKQTEEASYRTQLLLVTDGTYRTLKDETVHKLDSEETITYVTTDEDFGKGFYAIYFGSGLQAIGDTSFQIDDQTFTAGSVISGSLSFANTGSTAIRGSSANPVTVGLYAINNMTGLSTKINEWSIKSMIPSGNTVTLDVCSEPLSEGLSDGTSFYMFISEDAEYIVSQGGEPFSAKSSSLLDIGSKPELSIENAEITIGEIGDNYIDLFTDFYVTNRGSETAQDVFVQMKYENADGEIVPLSISEDYSSLIVGWDEDISILGAEEDAPLQMKWDEYPNGVITMFPYDNRALAQYDDIPARKMRHVHGTMRIDKSVFTNLSDKTGLDLMLEVFSAGSNASFNENHIYKATSEYEYTSSNNQKTCSIDHVTQIEKPLQVGLSIGNALRTSVQYSTTVKQSDMCVREISNGSGDWKPILSEVYFDISHSCIVAQAKEEGMTVIQIEDKATNTFDEIAVIVTDAGNGVNIYNDDYSFEFYNADGSKYMASADNQDWEFANNIQSWGGEGKPMNENICIAGKEGASLSFDTTATTLTLYYAGSVTISSDQFPGKTVSATNSSQEPTPVTVRFDNLSGAQHKITIKANTPGTEIDRYTAYYEEDTGTTELIGNEPPNIIWNRSFPNTASLYPDESVELTAYVLSTTGINSVTWNGEEVTNLNQVDSLIYSFDVTITENGTYETKVVAGNGSSAVNKFTAHWFSEVLAYNAISEVPEISRSYFTFCDRKTRQPSDENQYSSLLVKCEDFANPEEELFVQYVRYYDITGNNKWNWRDGGSRSSDGFVGMSQNGFYLMTIADEKGAWKRVPIQLDKIYASEPSVFALYNERNKEISVSLSLMCNPTRITLNDEDMEIPDIHFPTKGSYKFAIPVKKSGDYKIRVYYRDDVYTTKTVNVIIRQTKPPLDPTAKDRKDVQTGNSAVNTEQENTPATAYVQTVNNDPLGKTNNTDQDSGPEIISPKDEKGEVISGKKGGTGICSYWPWILIGILLILGIIFLIIILVKRRKDDDEEDQI